MIPYSEEIRRSIWEAHVESLHNSMLAANASTARWRAFRARLGRRLISVGERLARPSETFSPRTTA